jgi:hypothetical protein
MTREMTRERAAMFFEKNEGVSLFGDAYDI